MQILSQLDQNISFKDALTALKTLFTFPSPRHIEIKRQLRNALEEYYDSKAVLFDSGRTSLYLGLHALKKLKPVKKEVLVSAYTCAVVVNSIIKAGLKPVYVDINIKDFGHKKSALKSKINENTLALIVQNTFGFVDNYEFLTEFALQNEIFLIEDLAQSIGNEYKEQKLGTFGDFAFLSFGSSKIITSSRGGALVTRDRKIFKIVSKFKQQLGFATDKEVKKHLFKIFAFYFGSRIHFYGGKQILAVLAKLKCFPLIMTPGEKNIEVKEITALNYPPQLAKIALPQFQDLAKNVAHRKFIAATYHQELNNNPKITQFKYENTALLGYPILVSKPRKLHRTLFSKKIQLNLEWSFLNIVPKDINLKRTLYIPQSCKNAESVSKKMIYLPVHSKMNLAKIQRLITKITKYL
jgi:dTDP-4-amino-4,6-dideoxygalactose transaminase